MKKMLWCAFACALCAVAMTARADSFAFTATGVGFSASGTLVGNPDAYVAGAEDIYEATGTINGTAFTFVGPEGTTQSFYTTAEIGNSNEDFEYDNALFTGGGMLLDEYGLLFQIGSNYYNLDNEGSYLEIELPSGTEEAITFTIVPTPEPPSLMLLGSGALAVAWWVRRRFRDV